MTSETEYETDAWGNTGIPEKCQMCYGSGIEYGETCLTCGGYGFVCYEPDMEFFSKDPGKQLVEVKEKLTERLVSRRREYEYLDRIWPRRVVNMFRVTEEIEFLEKLLDQMERS